jgi:hypothetical protein
MTTKTKRKRVKHIALALPLDVVFVERLLPGILDFARDQGGWVFTRIPERLTSSFELGRLAEMTHPRFDPPQQ